MLLFYRNEFGYWLVKDLATRTTRERGVNRRTRNHDRNVCWVFWRGLFRHTQLSIHLEVQRMIQRFIGILEFGFGLVNLEKRG